MNKLSILLIMITIAATLSSDAQAKEPKKMNSTTEEILKVGYFPNTFPRDPVAINNFYEHVLIGQIIEPLVENSPTGELIPAVSKSWEISSDAKKITFHIRPGILFSNGKPVTAYDVKYTLMRHIKSGMSQSRGYLSRIVSVEVNSASSVSILLSEPYVAIFKVLSRDHLGIVPDGWVFNESSEAPFVGTGPYTAVKKEGRWLLVANKFYRAADTVSITSWEPILYNPRKPEYERLPLPDLVPYAQSDIVKALETKHGSSFKKIYRSEPINHFMQVSAWWYPHGKSFKNSEVRTVAMAALFQLLQERRRKLNFREATGVIPEGITGYLPPANKIVASGKNIRSSKKLSLTVAVVEKEFSNFVVTEDVEKIEQDFNVSFTFKPVGLTDFATLQESKPDAVVFAYAGGFHDAEGFLVVITAVLQSDLPTIFGMRYSDYLSAAQEADWTKRSSLYRNLNARMTTAGILAPGWKSKVLALYSDKIRPAGPAMSYTVKLTNYQRNPKEGR